MWREGVGHRRTEHGHHEVLAGLGLGVLSHARVGASLGGLQATQLEAAPAGDHAVHHAALCGVERRAGTHLHRPATPGATTGPGHKSHVTPRASAHPPYSQDPWNLCIAHPPPVLTGKLGSRQEQGLLSRPSSAGSLVAPSLQPFPISFHWGHFLPRPPTPFSVQDLLLFLWTLGPTSPPTIAPATPCPPPPPPPKASNQGEPATH